MTHGSKHGLTIMWLGNVILHFGAPKIATYSYLVFFRVQVLCLMMILVVVNRGYRPTYRGYRGPSWEKKRDTPRLPPDQLLNSYRPTQRILLVIDFALARLVHLDCFCKVPGRCPRDSGHPPFKTF